MIYLVNKIILSSLMTCCSCCCSICLSRVFFLCNAFKKLVHCTEHHFDFFQCHCAYVCKKIYISMTKLIHHSALCESSLEKRVQFKQLSGQIMFNSTKSIHPFIILTDIFTSNNGVCERNDVAHNKVHY